MYRIAVDSSNLIEGGGVTHLLEILNYLPAQNNIELYILASFDTCEKIKSKFAILNFHLIHINAYDRNIFKRNFWNIFKLSAWCNKNKIDLLFNPGGGYFGNFRPYVTMSRNMLIFEKEEQKVYGWSKVGLRLKILKIIHSKSIKNSDGVIFISNYAKGYIFELLNLKAASKVIFHGVSEIFNLEVKQQKGIHEYSIQNPYRLIYVSRIDEYKHQWNVAEAVLMLLNEKYPLELILVGDYYQKSFLRLQKIMSKGGKKSEAIKILGKQDYLSLHQIYQKSHGIIFASSCENMPNILIEGMKTSLPIACSEKNPMPEFLKSSGFYFDPKDVKSIHSTLKMMIDNADIRSEKLNASRLLASEYSWEKCAQETADFLRSTIQNYSKSKIR